jgi:opacity protein-like surface antigen
MNRRQIKPLIVACSLLFALATFVARGSDNGVYLRLDGGINFAQDPDLKINGQPGKLRLDTGYRADLAVGYDLNRWVGFELQGGYLYNSAESLTTGDRPLHVDNTWMEGIPLLASVRFHWHNRTDFVPYIGGGAGGLVSMLSIRDISDTTIVFAYEITAGLIYKIDERAWIDIGYKYLWAGDPNFDIGLDSVKASNVRNHFIGASVIWRF